jgi:hypothetical protein
MKKMNMVAKYEAIKAMLNGEQVENFSINEAIEFIEGRIEQVNKKNAGGGERKPTKTQLENEGVKETIVSALSAIGVPATIGEVQKSSAELGELSNQKISALLKQMVETENPAVRKIVDKRKTYFQLV